jgi:GT2 family glycosyltransferase
LHQPKPGAAAARNLGVREASGDLLLFLDDDIVADPQLIAEHAASQHGPEQAAVLGHVRLPWSKPASAWQQAMAEHAELFQSFNFSDPTNVPFTHFYTCNLSVQKSLFASLGGFDESFTSSGFEDIELGYRLSKAGKRIVYNPRASALHDVQTSFRRFAQKRRNTGRWLARMLELHPEARATLLAGAKPTAARTFLGWLGGLAAPMYELKAQSFTRRALAKCCWFSWQRSFWQGYRAALQEARGGS